jgi:hypothetical protein
MVPSRVLSGVAGEEGEEAVLHPPKNVPRAKMRVRVRMARIGFLLRNGTGGRRLG